LGGESLDFGAFNALRTDMKKTPNSTPDMIPLPDQRMISVDEMRVRARAFLDEMKLRRSVRAFSDRPVPREVIETCIRAAGTAPSGANKQPWHFAVVHSPDVKAEIRRQAEEAERRFYAERAPEEWLHALAPLGTNAEKPFLETAPYLIAVFAQIFGVTADGKEKHYFVRESVGLATGILIAALHHAGLATLTYTPTPMGFLSEVLGRPDNERPFLLLVTGYPADGATVPNISKKPTAELASFR